MTAPSRVMPPDGGKKWPKSRAKAIETGSRRYRSGFDCIRGHRNPLRFTGNGACVECQRMAQRPGGAMHETRKEITRRYQQRIREEFRRNRDAVEASGD